MTEEHREIEAERDRALRREDSWMPVLVAVRELWLMWKEGEYRPSIGSPEHDVMQVYDRVALLHPSKTDTLTCEACGRDCGIRANGIGPCCWGKDE